MSRYLIRFYKQDYMKYISHLDLLRLFKRSFKRMGIPLQHSQGFNPHPKMSFVQPLSLGYTSVGEYLDFETIEKETPQTIIEKLNSAMPKGIGLTACRELPPAKKTLAAIVEYGTYDLVLKTQKPFDWNEKVALFLKQDEIIIMKKQKKTKLFVEQDIKPMIREIKCNDALVDNNMISLTCTICAGSNRNLNPESLLKSLCSFAEVIFEKEALFVERKDLFCTKNNGQELTSISNIVIS